MTERSETQAPSPLEALMYPTGEVSMVLGPGTRKQLEAVLSQAAGGLLVAAIEGAGYEADDRWQLTIERVTLTRRAASPHEGEANGVAPPPANVRP
jgi:hypothetical protein